MLTKLPRWVWPAMWLLAFIAGMVNVVGLLGFEHQAVTHLTGTTSLFASAVGEADLSAAGHCLLVIGSFVGGAALSGLIVQDSTLQLGRRYGYALLLAAGLLALAVPLLWREYSLGMYAASCACGLQNAMVSTYSGTAVRTSHVSGMFTDLGIFLGHAARGIRVDRRRLRLCWVVITGFAGGGVAGAVSFQRLGYSALLLPSAGLLLAGAAYNVGQWRSRRVPPRP